MSQSKQNNEKDKPFHCFVQEGSVLKHHETGKAFVPKSAEVGGLPSNSYQLIQEPEQNFGELSIQHMKIIKACLFGSNIKFIKPFHPQQMMGSQDHAPPPLG